MKGYRAPWTYAPAKIPHYETQVKQYNGHQQHGHPQHFKFVVLVKPHISTDTNTPAMVKACMAPLPAIHIHIFACRLRKLSSQSENRC
jgi:hypothetical protein